MIQSKDEIISLPSVTSSTGLCLPSDFSKRLLPLDLRNENQGQVRDQQQVSWCYAFTAADIAIGYNQTKAGLFVRWLDLNVLHRKDPITSRVAHQNGFNKLALIKAMKDGFCPERIFPSESWTKMTRTQGGLDSIPETSG
jgi:hypothetical protein